MSEDGRRRAPMWLRRLIGWSLRPCDRAAQLAELDELFAERSERMGELRAALWYARQIPSFWSRSSAHALRGSADSRRRRIERPGAMDGLGWDVRHAVRGLARRPGYAAAVVLTLGVGIGGSVAVFSVANWMLLRPVPGVRAPSGLARVQLESTEFPGSGLPISHADFRDLVESWASGSAAVVSDQEVHVAVGEATPERVAAQFVSANYFSVLGVRLAEGRGFVDEEDRAGAAVVVVGERLRRRYGRGHLETGSPILVNGRPYRVIGVAPGGFRGAELPGVAELWFPAGSVPLLLSDPGVLSERGRQLWSRMLVRPAPGVSARRIEDELASRVESIRARERDHSFFAVRYRFRAHSGVGLDPALSVSVGRTLRLLGVVSALLLVLACANTANLELARGQSLRPSLVVRRALGASTGRLARERLVESLVIGLAGSAVGLGLAIAALRLFEGASLVRGSGALQDVTLDERVLGFAIVVALVGGVLAGLLPAAAASREHELGVIRATRHGERHTRRVRGALVVAQIALSVVLVVSAGLLERTLWNLRNIDTGVVTDAVLTFNLDPGLQGYEPGRSHAYVDEVLRGMQAQPGVAATGAAFVGAYESFYIPFLAMRLGGTRDRDGVAPRSFQVAGDFFGVLGLELLAGRLFEPAEVTVRDSTAPWLVVLNESAARAFFPELDPTRVPGQLLQRAVGGPTGGQPVRPITVVGVVRDARLGDVIDPAERYAFVPWGQGYLPGQVTFYVRTTGGTADVSARVRTVLQEADASLPAYRMGLLRERIDAQLVQQRFVATLSLLLGTLGVGLAALGAYAVLAYSVAERTREIGIRSALGARPGRIVGLVLRDGMLLTAVGVLLGVVAAGWMSRFLEARLFGVGRLDLATYAGGGAVMLVVALAACAIPGRRAVRVDPMAALRQD